MLLITRKACEELTIFTPAGPVVVRVVGAGANRCKLGVEAPAAVPVRREELLPREVREEIERAARVGHRAQLEGQPQEGGRETD